MPNYKSQKGVALLEVLIAMFVMAFGFLALLKLQMASLSNITTSNQRYVAASLAQAMGEKIRANVELADQYTGLETRTFTKNCSVANTCGAAHERDAYQWQQSLLSANSGLTNANGTVVHDGNEIRVRIEWEEKHSNRDATTELFELKVFL